MPARKLRQKERKKRKRHEEEPQDLPTSKGVEREGEQRGQADEEHQVDHLDFVVEPLPESILSGASNAEAFEGVLARFGVAAPSAPTEEEEKREEEEENKRGEIMGESDESEDEQIGAVSDQILSHLPKKKRKEMQQSLVSKLKQVCKKPEVVEVWDATAPDPFFLVDIKSIPNTVPVPQHWSNKRKYLQGKRGIEKPPFELPEFIAATGIQKIRDAYAEKEEDKKMKQKQRERITGKISKIDIDYQVLHDAFFRYQTKPKLTRFGDTYYEGKEFESSSKVAGGQGFRPSILSQALRTALGMPPPPPHGPHVPPPWLLAQQRYGPPPSYPSLKIPGVNAPLPQGAQYGFHIGGWGMPPVDEHGVPLYGDVFGPPIESADGGLGKVDLVDRSSRWGEIKPYESEEEPESEEEEEEEEEEMEEELLPPPPPLMHPPIGDARLDLRKEEAAVPGAPPQLYHVLETKKASIDRGTLLGTDHTYVLPGSARPGLSGGVEVSLQPDELNEDALDPRRLAEKYHQQLGKPSPR